MNLKTIDPKICIRWHFADRSGFEFGNIHTLGLDIQKHGQLEPAVVRPIKHKKAKFEVIAGSRRHRACLEMDLPFLVIVKKLNDTEAMVHQARENDKEKISDYSRGIHYHTLVASGVVRIVELSRELGISRNKINSLLAFARVPKQVWEAVIDMRHVSARSARTIAQISAEGSEYVDALISIAPQIRQGIGCNQIEKLVQQNMSQKPSQLFKKSQVTSSDGRVIATWTPQGLKFSSHFVIDQAKLTRWLKSHVQKQFS